MRGFMKRVDLFCYKHPRFGIRNLMLFIVIGTLIVWLFSAMDTTRLFTSFLTFNPAAVLHGQVWRLITFVFIPQSSGIWLLLFLYFYYFIGILLTVIYGFIVYFVTGRPFTLTSNYINLSMFFAFATLYPEQRVLVFYIIPVKIKWLAIVDALYFLYDIFSMLGAGYGMISFLPLVAVLNYFIFCGDTLFRAVRPASRKQRESTINFKRAAQQIRHEQRSRGYTRKCEVCGRTDTDYPDLEFRYCSRCKGVHCFCQDHINNHVHFTE